MEEKFLISLGTRIKEARVLKGLTQSELAEQVGYSEKSSIARVEHGQVDLPLSKIEDIASVLGCNPSTLMGWDDEQSSPVLEDREQKLLSSFALLNDSGQEEALKRVEELTELPKYKK